MTPWTSRRKLLLASPELFLGRLALAQVARDLGEAEEVRRGVADRVDDDVGPEARAVLADAPALVLEAALFHRRLQGAFRQAGGAVFLGIEPGEVLAEDFRLLVALESPRARIPARDHAGRIEHVDRVVGNRIDEQPIAAIVALGCAHPLRSLQLGPLCPSLCAGRAITPQNCRNQKLVPASAGKCEIAAGSAGYGYPRVAG